MNFFGHCYVAYKSLGRLNPYLVAGSLLPDLVPFIQQKVFSFEEIHESGDKFLYFLDQKYPRKRDLALGMTAHSVKFGADRFNREIDGWLLKERENLRDEIIKDIVSCSGVSQEVASGYRMHNYLWNGIEVYLLKKNLFFVSQLEKLKDEIDAKEISRLLAEFFGKEISEVKKVVDQLLRPIKKYRLSDLDGLIKIWKETLAGLPEKDQVKEVESKELFIKIYSLFENDWPEIIEKIERSVAKNLRSFLRPQS